MEGRETVDGDWDLLTGDAGRVRPRTADGDGCDHAHVRTDVGGTEVSLLSHTHASVVLHLTASSTTRSHELP